MRILNYAHPVEHQFEKIVVWSSDDSLSKLPDAPWIIKQGHPWLNRNIGWRVLWRATYSRSQIKLFKCDSIFSPGALFFMRPSVPVISMGQNLLPFDMREILRFGFCLFTLRLLILRLSQTFTLSTSKGNIFLSHFSKKKIEKSLRKNKIPSIVIPHGVDDVLFLKPRVQESISSYSREQPFRLLYVSPLWPYKNHNTVILAASLLRRAGYWIRLDIVGGHPHKPSLEILYKEMSLADENQEYIFYHGSKLFEELTSYYHEANLFVFASSCESFGQIVTEAMASGLPIACSDLSSMREILKDGAVYFNPFDHQSLFQVLTKMINSIKLRTQIASTASQYASQYSWANCANKTLDFIVNQTQKSNSNEVIGAQIYDEIVSSPKGLSRWTLSTLKKITTTILLGLAAFFLYKYGQEILRVYQDLNHDYVFMGVAFAIMSIILGAIKLSFIFNYVFSKKIDFVNWLKVYVEGFFINNTIPYLGLAYRAFVLKKVFDISYTEYVSATYLAAILGLFTVVLFSSLALSFGLNRLEILGFLIFFVALMVMKVFLLGKVKKSNTGFNKINILIEKINTIKFDFLKLKKSPNFSKYICLLLITMGIDFLAYAFVFYGFNIALPFVSILFIYLAYSLSWMIKLTPANIGIQEFFVSLAGSYVGFGIINGIALSLALRVVSILGAAILYLILILLKVYRSSN